jgi:hypothetical protein
VVKTLNTAPSALDDAQLANGWAVTGETSPNDGHLGRIEKRALDTELHFPRVPDSIAVPKVARTRTVLPRSEAQVLNVDVAALDKKNKKLGLVPETLDEQWARAKKEPDNPEGINAFRTRPGGVPKVIEAAPGQEAQLEVLRQQRWAKIQELRQMIEASKNPDEAELFNEVLTQVMERYVADHGEMPVGI